MSMAEQEHNEHPNPTEAEIMKIEADNLALIAQGIKDGSLTFTVTPDGTTILTDATGKRIEYPDGRVDRIRPYNGRVEFWFPIGPED